MSFGLVCTARSFNKISWNSNAFFTIGLDERDRFTIGRVFEVKQEVRSNTMDPFMGNGLRRNILIFENDGGSVNRVRVELRTGRNRVVARLETGNSGHDDIEWNGPFGGIFRCG